MSETDFRCDHVRIFEGADSLKRPGSTVRPQVRDGLKTEAFRFAPGLLARANETSPRLDTRPARMQGTA